MEIEERDVILVGLGDFGSKTVKLFNSFLEERKHQIKPEVLKKTNVYPIEFQTKGPFSYTYLSERIDDLVKESQAKKFNGQFSYIFVGDLYDQGTSLYAVDFGYLPWTIERAGSLKKKDVLGFFTFADAYGATVKADNSSMVSILNFFKRMNDIDYANEYIPPYKDPNGHDFGSISSPTGPFDRNYVLVTPGNQDAVDRDTSQIFAERIFYELFYLSSTFDRIEIEKHGERDRNSGKLFSSFSMIQISRLEDLQHYFLKYTREDQISEYLLADSIKGTDLDYYQQQFFNLIDIPKDKEFPIGRAVNLFINENKPALSQLLDVYQSKQNEDFSDYINTCKSKIEFKLQELTPKYTEFTRFQIDHMLETFEQGYQQLFNINRLTGNINTYILYVEKLSERLNYWEASLRRILEETRDLSMEADYKAAENKINKIQKSFIYKIPLFVPIRRKLIESIILSLPLEKYLRENIKKNLAQSFLDQWEDKSTSSRNPVSDCEELIAALKKMKDLMTKKKELIKQKINYISNMPSYYYVISQKEQEEYSELLNQIRSEYFGTAKKSALEEQAKEFFKTWTEGKSRQKITNSSEFIKHFDSFIESKTVVSMDNAYSGANADEFGAWADDAVRSMEKRTEQLTHKSFKSDSKKIGETRILLNPDRKLDQLSEKVKERFDDSMGMEKLVIPREFTLGSVVYFQDWLWMDKDEFQQYNNLLKYEKDSAPLPKYASSSDAAKTAPAAAPKTEPAVTSSSASTVTAAPSVSAANEASSNSGEYPTEEEMTFMDQNVRSILLDFCEPWVRLAWYKGKFDEEKETLTDEQVRKLAKAIDISDLLQSLEDKQLHDYAKEIGCPLSPIKDRQIDMIIKFIRKNNG